MKKILIVEDDLFLQDLLALKLKAEGYNVFLAGNAEECFDILHKEKPDIILLDIILPHTDGFEILGQIKKDKELSGIPVIILSNLGEKEEVKKGLALGAVDYLVKAMFSISDIMVKVKKFVPVEEAKA